MDENGLCELMSVAGFYNFLAQQAQLPPEEVKKIYLLGRPWGVWPPDIDIVREAADAQTDVFTYLAALQPLVDMDTQEKETELSAYETALAEGDSSPLSQGKCKSIGKVAMRVGEEEQTICKLLHALYGYRQQVGKLSIEKMVCNKVAARAKLQSAIAAEARQDFPPPR
jgi:hypothetical protein